MENNIRVRLSILTVETRYSIRLLYLSLCPGSWLSTLIIFFPSPLYVGRGPWLLYIFRFIIAKQERPYQHDSTASRLLSEVKHARAQLVLRWGTTLESWVLFFLAFFQRFQSCFCNALHYIYLNLWCRNRNDHTSMTAPLPVCSAKLSMLGLS